MGEEGLLIHLLDWWWEGSKWSQKAAHKKAPHKSKEGACIIGNLARLAFESH
jgi:hypothetical protein